MYHITYIGKQVAVPVELEIEEFVELLSGILLPCV